jgi:hypothetical protein
VRPSLVNRVEATPKFATISMRLQRKLGYNAYEGDCRVISCSRKPRPNMRSMGAVVYKAYKSLTNYLSISPCIIIVVVIRVATSNAEENLRCG